MNQTSKKQTQPVQVASERLPHLSMSPAQAWLNQRLLGQSAERFGGSKKQKTRFFTTSNLSAPPGFENAWHIWSPDTELSMGELDALTNTTAIIIFGNSYVEAERKLLSKLALALSGLGPSPPLLVWVHHAVAPETLYKGRKVSRWPVTSAISDCVSELLKNPLDKIILEQREGALLSLTIQSFLRKADVIATRLCELIEAKRNKTLYSGFLKGCIDRMLWDYMRGRIAPCIPPVDDNIPTEGLTEVGDYIIDRGLGQGLTGYVYKLHPKDKHAEKSREAVVKIVPKDQVNSINDLKSMKRSVDIMKLLSKPEHMHHNIVQLFEIYHSAVSIMFVMEDGGPENLCQRLCYRDHTESVKRRPMSLRATESLIFQALTALQHLHSNVRVCHRDIKPENFVVLHMTEDDDLILKLADFDLSCLYQKSDACKSLCGTMPFLAPEVVLDKEYDGLLCDVWSLGITLLEVLCGVGVLEKVLQLHHPSDKGITPVKKNISKIAHGFATPQSASKLLKKAHLPQYEPLVNAMQGVIDGMLCVDVKHRWSADLSLEGYTAKSQKPDMSEH